MKLYSTNCPRCKVLEKKLKNKNIDFDIVTDFDIDLMKSKGFTTAPIFETDNGELLDFSAANNYINQVIR